MAKDNFIKALEIKRKGQIEKSIIFLEKIPEEQKDIWDYFGLALVYQAFGLIKESYWNILKIFDIIIKQSVENDLKVSFGLFKKEFERMPLISLSEEEEGRKHYILALSYKDAELNDKAEIAFRKSVTLSKGRNLEKVLLSFSQFYAGLNRVDDAIKLLSRATKIVEGDENIARIEYRLATFYEQKKDYDKAYELYMSVQSRVPEYLDLEEKINAVKYILQSGGNK